MAATGAVTMEEPAAEAPEAEAEPEGAVPPDPPTADLTGPAERATIVIVWEASTGKLWVKVSATSRASEEDGRTWASAGVSSRRSAGTAASNSRAAVARATSPGRRMTPRANRYQAPCSDARAVRAAERCRRAGESASIRGPRATRRAGSTIKETAPADSATIEPPIPIE